MSSATRVDEMAEANRDVRIFFDLLRRDLAQARISTTNRNFFIGTTNGNEISFTASSSKLRSNNISDARLIAYRFVPDAKIVFRAEVQPTIQNLTTDDWKPAATDWSSKIDGPDATGSSDGTAGYFWEPVLTGVLEYGDGVDFFTPRTRETGALYDFPNIATQLTSPPAGIQVAFRLLTRSARARKLDESQISQIKEADFRKFNYDIELNLPPAYNP